jgi:hypothetical protein
MHIKGNDERLLDLMAAVEECQRFMDKAQGAIEEYERRIGHSEAMHIWANTGRDYSNVPTCETNTRLISAAKRASLDLSQALVEVRRR